MVEVFIYEPSDTRSTRVVSIQFLAILRIDNLFMISDKENLAVLGGNPLAAKLLLIWFL